MPRKVPEITIGDKYGDWEILEAAVKIKKDYYHLCRCKCGCTKFVLRSNLYTGKSKSCNKGICRSLSITHGLTDHPLYIVWRGIKYRTGSPTGNNSCYAGVLMSPLWEDFQNFYDWAISAGYMQGLSIDRKDSKGDYCPENCRWTNNTVQSQNRGGWKKAEIPYKGVFKAKPRNGKTLYKGTGKNPYYYIFTYKGKRYQSWGYSTAEEAYMAKCAHIEKDFKGLVYP